MFKATSLLIIFVLISACKPVSEQNSVNAKPMPLPQCIESQSQCEIITGLASFSIKFSQIQMLDKVKTELPFFIELNQIVTNLTEPNIAKPLSITKVSAYLEGKDMFMGKVPLFFEKKTTNNSNNKFIAQSLLANCTEEQMVWRLWVTVKLGEQEQTAFIDFTSERL